MRHLWVAAVEMIRDINKNVSETWSGAVVEHAKGFANAKWVSTLGNVYKGLEMVDSE